MVHSTIRGESRKRVKSIVNTVWKKQALLILVMVGFAALTAHAKDRLAFENAWIRAMPPGMKMTAGFGALSNHGERPLTLVAFSSPAFGEVSLHRSELVDGVSRMREVTSLSLEPGQTIELAPGGYHLMLMMPRGGIEAGARISVVMSTDDGLEFSFQLPVEKR
jgi:copper(I)-binding protein